MRENEREDNEKQRKESQKAVKNPANVLETETETETEFGTTDAPPTRPEIAETTLAGERRIWRETDLKRREEAQEQGQGPCH